MIVCHCHVVRCWEVEQAVAAGATSIDDVAASCGAASSCGGCGPAIDRIIRERSGVAVSLSRAA